MNDPYKGLACTNERKKDFSESCSLVLYTSKSKPLGMTESRWSISSGIYQYWHCKHTFRILSDGIRLHESSIRPSFLYDLRRYCTSYQKLACFVLYHKIINNFLKINPNTFAGLVGKVRKKLSSGGGRKGGWRKKISRSAPAGPGDRTRDLPRARRGSPAARQGGCLDKQAFPCLKKGKVDCATPCAACFGDS